MVTRIEALQCAVSIAAAFAFSLWEAGDPIPNRAAYVLLVLVIGFSAAIGYAGVDDLDVEKVRLYLDDVLVAADGGRHPAYREADGQRVMQQPEITVRAVLGRGEARATVWTCDLSYDYVKINAEYRT